MKKRDKKSIFLISLFLLTLFSMTACRQSLERTGDESNNNTEGNIVGKKEISKDIPLGRFVEEDIRIPDEIKEHFDTVMMEDGNIQMLSFGEERSLQSHISRDGGISWEKNQNVSGQMIPEGYEVSAGVINSFGDVFVNCGKVIDTNPWGSSLEGPYKYYKITSQGEVKEFQVNLEGVEPGEFGHRVQLETTKEGDLLILHTMEGAPARVYYYDRESLELRQTIEASMSEYHAKIVGKEVILEDGDTYVSYDLETKEKTENLNAEPDFFSGSIIEGEEKEEILMANKTGLYSYRKDSGVVEQLIDGGLTTFGAPDSSISKLIYVNPEEFLVVFREEYGVCVLKHYQYNSEVPSVPANEITVYSLYANEVIQKLILEFQKENPDIHVNYEIGMTEDTVGSTTEVIKLLNTEIMAGNGPDVLFFGSGIPMDSYVEKGMLKNIDSVINPMLEAGELYENILEVYQKDSGFYAAPFGFRVPVAHGQKEDLTLARDMDGILKFMNSEKVKNYGIGDVFADFDRRKFLRFFTSMYSDQWMKEGKIDEEELEKFLITCKEIYVEDKSHWESWRIENETNTNTPTEFLEEIETLERLSDEYFFQDAITDFFLGSVNIKCLMDLGYLCGVDQLANMFNTALQSDDSTDYQLLDTKFSVSLAAGISAKTLNEAEALLFIEYMLSEEGQMLQGGGAASYGFPVNRSAFQKMMQAPSKDILEKKGTNRGNYVWPDDAYFARFEELVQTLKGTAMQDKILFDALDEQAKPYMLDQKEVSSVVSEFKQKMDLYLSE